jgi:ABC-type tungstate transport system permease subunit
MLRRTLIAAMALTALACLPISGAQAVVLNIQGTSDVSDSHISTDLMGAVGGVNANGPGSFGAFSPGDSFTYVGGSTGAAIAAAEVPNNTVDAIIVHSLPQEATFVNNGFSAEVLGRAIFYNDYVIVGPMNDPAHVLTLAPHDAVAAYEAIAQEGAQHDADVTAGSPTPAAGATFVSRNNQSGTSVAEYGIWGQTTGVVTQSATGNAGSLTLLQPEGGTPPAAGTFPNWYAANTGATQGNNLVATDTCAIGLAPDGGCYTMVDRGTYDYDVVHHLISNLQIVSQNNASTAPGGESELTNPFHAYIVSTSKNKAVAKRFLDYLTSPGFQNSLVNFPGGGLSSVFPDAAPQITASSIPTSAAAGAAITIHATLKYPPPVAQPIAGLPVHLQASPTGVAGTYVDVGQAVSTAADGSVTFTPSVGNTTIYYQLRMDAYQDDALASIFSASVNPNLGTQSGRVDVATPTEPPTPTVTVTAPAPAPITTTTTAPTTTTTPPTIPTPPVTFTKLKTSSTGTLSIGVRLPSAGKATIAATVRVHGRKITYGKSVTVSSQTTRTIIAVLRRSSAAAKALKHVRSATVSVTITFTSTGGKKLTASLSVPVS